MPITYLGNLMLTAMLKLLRMIFAEHFIYFFDQNAWFSLYESQSPSYFICYNTTSPLSLGTVLQIDFDQLNSFL